MNEYDHLKIEKKWQSVWAKKKAYKTGQFVKSGKASAGKKYYVLDMFPYPSGTGLHVGHPKGYIGSDIFARMKRMQGFNVLHPMGYDAFGLPAEQYALEHNISPKKAVEENIKTFEKQLSIIGLSYDWDRRINTTDPDFYHFTQWIFLKIYGSWYNKSTEKAEPIETLVKKFEKSGNIGNSYVNAVTDNTEIFSALEWKSKTEKEKQDILMKYRLAYEGYSEVNWCPGLGTVLANDEILEAPKGLVSERGGFPVEKKIMRQWFLRITAYADRLLTGLDGLNWSEHIKEIQKNWIGKSEGLIFSAKVKDTDITIKTFSTHFEACYADTFFVIAPDHELLPKLLEGLPQKDEVLKKAKEIVTRRNSFPEGKNVEEHKEIDGVFTGRYAVDPLGNGNLPIWVAGFALANYGTGIVKCSAHDERDFAFAKKYNIPLKEVIEPLVIRPNGLEDSVKLETPFKERKAVVAVIKHWSQDKYLGVEWGNTGWRGFVIGGIEEEEDAVSSGLREIVEETGYKNPKFIKSLGGMVHAKFYQTIKKENRFAHFEPLLFQLKNDERLDISGEEEKLHKLSWLSPAEFESFITNQDMKIIWDRVMEREKPILNGILNEPSEFKGREVSTVREEIANWLVEKGFAVRQVNYKMRDAVFARQRYWGEPIPLRHDKNGIIHELLEKDLPLILPEVKSYRPTGTGESPLANVHAWVKKGLETNTMPGWAGSSWYFLRYMDPKNKKVFADKKTIEYWKNVDMYVGGAEHATGHLLYSRFWHKILKDYGLTVTEEPFQALHNPGMMFGADNRKMSKRWGNVVNPDDVVKTYGADTFRVYEMFMGPFNASLPWSMDNIIGSRRFLEKVWKVSRGILDTSPKMSRRLLDTNQKLEILLHKTIKKVTEDIENFNFNTAVSSMMILVNEFEKQKKINKKDWEMFLKILSPFAPHITEEIWHELGHKTLLVTESWPKPDKNKMKEKEVKIAVQINSKVRAECTVALNMKEENIVNMVKILPAVEKWLSGKEIKKVIYIPGKLINFVV